MPPLKYRVLLVAYVGALFAASAFLQSVSQSRSKKKFGCELVK
jgi:hypothetical protein